MKMFLAKSGLYELQSTDDTRFVNFRCRKDGSIVKCSRAKLYIEEEQMTLLFEGAEVILTRNSLRRGKSLSKDLFDMLKLQGYLCDAVKPEA